MKKYLILIVVLILINASQGIAQQNNTMYFMSKIPQANLMNPANQPYCKFYLGLPVISSIYFNYGNNGFALSDAIYPENGQLHLDANNFFETLQPVNNISFDTDFNLFALGFRIKNMYFFFNNSLKMDFGFSFPKGFFGLLFDGNMKHLGTNDPLDLSGFGLDFNAYGETGLGLSRKFGDKLTLGVRGKLYSGILNLYTEKSDLKWYTDPESWAWDFDADLTIRITSPANVNIDSLEFEIPNTDEILDYFLSYQNFGYGLDLGFNYDLTSKLNVSASVIDLGSIKWKNGVQSVHSSAKFGFDGIDVGNLKEAGSFADTIIQSFNFTSDKLAYSTSPPTKVYIGASYFLNSNWGFGALYRSKIYNNLSFNSLTLSASTGLGNFMALTGSYSIAYNSFNNIGLGVSMKLAFFQFYLINDNIMGVVFPQNTRNLNFRFGINIIMGCRGEKKEAAKKEKDILRQQNDIDPAFFF